MIEKILEKIENLRTFSHPIIKKDADKKDFRLLSKKDVIEAVKEVAKDDGWISCKERLPEEKENPITKDYYVYPVMVDLGERKDIRYYGFGDGHWWHGLTKMDDLVTHWMDIKPYRQEEEQYEDLGGSM